MLNDGRCGANQRIDCCLSLSLYLEKVGVYSVSCVSFQSFLAKLGALKCQHICLFRLSFSSFGLACVCFIVAMWINGRGKRERFIALYIDYQEYFPIGIWFESAADRRGSARRAGVYLLASSTFHHHIDAWQFLSRQRTDGCTLMILHGGSSWLGLDGLCWENWWNESNP